VNCQEVEPLLTRYVDDEVAPSERERVAGHLAACRACASRAAKEQAARRLVQLRSRALAAPAPPALRARCAALAPRPRRSVSQWSRWRVVGLAAATAVVVLTAVIGVGAITHSNGILVAGLTLDHLKCFGVHATRDEAPADVRAVEAALERNYGWRVKVPDGLAAQALTLVGARRCLSTDGTTAHVMYRHAGRAVSLYVLPAGAVHRAAVTSFAGHPATIWSSSGRTYVLVGSENDAEMRPVAAYFRSAVN
jgi:anti-sigma factor RsiW